MNEDSSYDRARQDDLLDRAQREAEMDTLLNPEETESCGHPCAPNKPCSAECSAYWDRMRREGFWKDGTGWTPKGMGEMMK